MSKRKDRERFEKKGAIRNDDYIKTKLDALKPKKDEQGNESEE